MDEEVEKELSNLVKILIETVPSLNSVRLFGSYLNGKWNPKTSDIDILVCVIAYSSRCICFMACTE